MKRQRTFSDVATWAKLAGLIEPFYFLGVRGRPPKGIEIMLRMYFLSVWYNLADEAVEEAVYDSYAMRKFMGIDFLEEDVSEATTLLRFRHLLEEKGLQEKMLEEVNKIYGRERGNDAGRDDSGRYDHRGALFEEEQREKPGSGDALDEEREPVAFWDESAYWCRRGERDGTQRGSDCGKCCAVRGEELLEIKKPY